MTTNSDFWYAVKHKQTGDVIGIFPDTMLAGDYRDSLEDQDVYSYIIHPVPQPGQVRVKELEWVETRWGATIAETPVGQYAVYQHTGESRWKWCLSRNGASIYFEYRDSLNAAKQACQEHFNGVVRGCLD